MRPALLARLAGPLALGLVGLIACGPRSGPLAGADLPDASEAATNTDEPDLGSSDASRTIVEPGPDETDLAGEAPSDGGVDPTADMTKDTNAVLSWDSITMNIDGTPVTNLGGYWVYRGLTTPLTAQNAIDRIDAGNLTTYTFTNLGAGTHYFRVSGYTSSGLESDLSAEVSKTILP